MRGTLIDGRYLLGERVGAGGMGVVYEAEDLLRARRVALKIVHEDCPADLIAVHVEREASVGLAIRHPHVVRVIERGEFGNRPFVVMEYARGEPLGVAAAKRPFSTTRAIALVRQILEGLGAIHRAGFIHGDLKSDNVLVECGPDGSDIATIIDLGLADLVARPRARGSERERTISGTPTYVAPELVEGGAKTVASDLYAVGVILYELLTGAPPFVGRTPLEILRRQVEDAVTPPSQRAGAAPIALALERAVMCALEKRPAARYRDADAFAAALAAIACGDLAARSADAFDSMDERTMPDLPIAFAIGTRPPAELVQPRSDAIVTAALARASASITQHRLQAARRELEAAFAAIDKTTLDSDDGAWCLLVPLAALYDRLGDPQRARSTAHLALDRAIEARSALGCRRAKKLVERLSRGGPPYSREACAST